jgi:hypothetical protein
MQDNPVKSVEASKVETVLGESAHLASNAVRVRAGYGLRALNGELAGHRGVSRQPNAQKSGTPEAMDVCHFGLTTSSTLRALSRASPRAFLRGAFF